MQHRPRSSSAWGSPYGWLAALLAGALALRLDAWDDASRPNRDVVAAAWEVTHGGDRWPRGGFVYLLAPFQWWQSAPSYETGRIVVLVCGLLGIAAAWWLGRVAYGTAAAFVAAAALAVDPAHVAASRQVVAALPLAALAAAALALAATDRIELAGAATGLALAVDLHGAPLLVALVVVAWRRWRRLAIAGAAALVLGAPGLWAVHGYVGPRSVHAVLWDGLGPVLALSALGLVGAVALRTRPDRALASFALAEGAMLLVLPHVNGRATLPLAVALGALAGRFRSLTPVALLLLVLPLTWSLRDAQELRRDSASTMVRGETGHPRRDRARRGDAARLRLLRRR